MSMLQKDLDEKKIKQNIDYKYWRYLRNKESKTPEEWWMLQAKSALTIISEYMLSYNKQECDAETTLEDINKYLDNNVLNNLL